MFVLLSSALAILSFAATIALIRCRLPVLMLRAGSRSDDETLLNGNVLHSTKSSMSFRQDASSVTALPDCRSLKRRR